MLAGLREATGDYLVLMDADLQHPPALLPKMYRILRDSGGAWDLCGGRRRGRAGESKIRACLSRSFYQVLLMGGVKIYEYIPGFLHAKSCVIDGKIATVGSVNLDHRSLFLQFENNSLFYRSSIADEVKKDFLTTQERCREIAPYNQTQYAFRLVFDGILRIFAPLC